MANVEILPHLHPATLKFSSKYLSHKIIAACWPWIWPIPHITDGTLRASERRDWSRVTKLVLELRFLSQSVTCLLKPRETSGEVVKGCAQGSGHYMCSVVSGMNEACSQFP